MITKISTSQILIDMFRFRSEFAGKALKGQEIT